MFRKIVFVVTVFISTFAHAGGADAGGYLVEPTILIGEKFSFLCELTISSGDQSEKQTLVLNNESNKSYPKAQSRDITQFLDAQIFILDSVKSPSHYFLYLTGRVKGIDPQLWLTSKATFSSKTDEFEADLLSIQYGKTDEYGLNLRCKKQ